MMILVVLIVGYMYGWMAALKVYAAWFVLSVLCGLIAAACE